MHRARTASAVLAATLSATILSAPAATAAPTPTPPATRPVPPAAAAGGASSAVAWSVMGVRGLPYTVRVDFLSGADKGVHTPDLASNGGGRICLAPDLHESKAPDGNLPGHYGYFARLWLAKRLQSDTRIGGTLSFAVGSEPKRCWNGVPHNAPVYVQIRKSRFISGQLLAGQGRVTYS